MEGTQYAYQKTLSQKLLFHSNSEIGLGMLPIPPALKEANEHCLGCWSDPSE